MILDVRDKFRNTIMPMKEKNDATMKRNSKNKTKAETKNGNKRMEIIMYDI